MNDDPVTGVEVLHVEVDAPIISLRDPLYSGVQVGLPCPPPATVGGLLAAAAGGWQHVDPSTRFAMSFRASGSGSDLETYHPLDAGGAARDPRPTDRQFLAQVQLVVWIVADVALWQRRLRRPVWPLRLGRSQDLVGVRTRLVHLQVGQGIQGQAIVPADITTSGRLLRLPTAISLDRTRTRWDSYRYHPAGADDTISADGVDDDGAAVVLLPPSHPHHTGPLRSGS